MVMPEMMPSSRQQGKQGAHSSARVSSSLHSRGNGRRPGPTQESDTVGAHKAGGGK